LTTTSPGVTAVRPPKTAASLLVATTVRLITSPRAAADALWIFIAVLLSCSAALTRLDPRPVAHNGRVIGGFPSPPHDFGARRALVDELPLRAT
jgi:hypothetical protein